MTKKERQLAIEYNLDKSESSLSSAYTCLLLATTDMVIISQDPKSREKYSRIGQDLRKVLRRLRRMNDNYLISL